MNSIRFSLCLFLLSALAVDTRAQNKQADQPPGNRFALLVGVTKYPNLESRWNLAGGGNDCKLLKDVLTRRFKFPDDDYHVRVLTDEHGTKRPELLPTKANIEREFKRLADKNLLKPDDQVVILLSGHGSQQEADWS